MTAVMSKSRHQYSIVFLINTLINNKLEAGLASLCINGSQSVTRYLKVFQSVTKCLKVSYNRFGNIIIGGKKY